LPHDGFAKLVPTTLPHACLLDAQGQVACGNLLEDAPLEPLGGPGMIDVVASYTQICALSSAGKVSCWKDGQALDLPAGW
jgi:hypothetical protein